MQSIYLKAALLADLVPSGFALVFLVMCGVVLFTDSGLKFGSPSRMFVSGLAALCSLKLTAFVLMVAALLVGVA